MVKKIDIVVKGFKCERCNHMWVPKGKNAPRVCPNCKSPYWDVPRKEVKAMVN